MLLTRAPGPAAEPQPPETLVVAPGERISLASPKAGGSVEAAFDGGLLVPVKGVLTAPPAGDHWLAVASRDGLGGTSTVRWTHLRVDGEPPAVTLEIVPAPVTDTAGRSRVTPGSRVRVRATDAVAGVSGIFLSTGAAVVWTAGAAAEAALPRTGSAHVRAWAVDRVGNVSGVERLEILVGAQRVHP